MINWHCLSQERHVWWFGEMCLWRRPYSPYASPRTDIETECFSCIYDDNCDAVPVSCMSSLMPSFHEPAVSMETGRRYACLPVPCPSCICSQLPDRLQLLPTWLCHVYMSPHMCPAPSCPKLSYGLYCAQGISVSQSGRLPSCINPTDSLTAGIWASEQSKLRQWFDCDAGVTVHFLTGHIM